MEFKIKHFFGAGALLYATFAFVACGKNSSSNGGGTGGSIVVCNPGQACTNTYVNASMPYGFYGENYRDKNLTVTNQSVYREFLKSAMGTCDQGTYNGGYSNCNQWQGGSLDVVLQGSNTNSNTLTAVFRAWPALQSQYYSYAYQFPSFTQFLGSMFGFPIISESGAYRNPLTLNLTVSVTNNYQGFEARGYGDMYTTANRSLIQVIANKGKLTDGSMDVQLTFGNQSLQQNQVFASGRFIRCQTAECTPVYPW